MPFGLSENYVRGRAGDQMILHKVHGGIVPVMFKFPVKPTFFK